MCIDKSDWCPFNPHKKMFYFYAKDKTGSINIAAIGSLADRFFPILRNGQIYFISNGFIKPAHERSGSTHPYEMRLTTNSIITLLPLQLLPSIPNEEASTPLISRISGIEIGTVLDIAAVVNEIGVLQAILPSHRSSNSEAISKRQLVLIDDTQHSIHLLLWDHLAANYDPASPPIIHATAVMLLEHRGAIILSATPNTTIIFNDASIPATPRLTEWYKRVHMLTHFKPLSVSLHTSACIKCNRSFTPQCCKECEHGTEAPSPESPTEEHAIIPNQTTDP